MAAFGLSNYRNRRVAFLKCKDWYNHKRFKLFFLLILFAPRDLVDLPLDAILFEFLLARGFEFDSTLNFLVGEEPPSSPLLSSRESVFRRFSSPSTQECGRP